MFKVNNTPLRTVVKTILWLIAGFLYFYFTLPAINLRSEDFYIFVGFLCVAWIVLTLLFGASSKINVQDRNGYSIKSFASLKQAAKNNLQIAIPVVLIILMVIFNLLGAIFSSVFFNAKDYSALLVPEAGNFAEDVEEISYDQIPMLDEVSANTLAVRKLGELSDIVSQFEADGNSTQINNNGTPVRITYLNYGDFFKWLNNFSEGIPAYILTDMVTQEVTVVRLEEGIKYSPSEYFFRDVDRYLRFKYPTKMFTDVDFEIDDNGVPYWIASVTDRTIGVFGGVDVVGAVLVNAINGESEYYSVKDMPEWVDRIYTSDLIIEQYDYYGKFHDGFWNYMFSQTGCTETTDGYNYIAIDTDIYLYTGITSVVGDESNIGFILVNQRTKEAKFYPGAGAEEYSAMDSAQGAVQQFAYKATFPILLNIAGEPTYFMSLKDDSNLVKMYAMVNMAQYQIVSTATSVKQCEENYYQLLLENGFISEDSKPPVTDPSVKEDLFESKVEDVRVMVVSGTTHFYVKLEGKESYFDISGADFTEAVLINVGDPLLVKWSTADSDKRIIPVTYMEITSFEENKG
jgi:hypothetical protein